MKTCAAHYDVACANIRNVLCVIARASDEHHKDPVYLNPWYPHAYATQIASRRDAVTRKFTKIGKVDAVAHTTAMPYYDAFTCDTIGFEDDAVTHSTTRSEDDAVTHSTTGSDAITHTTARPYYDAFTCDSIGLDYDAFTCDSIGLEDDAVTRSTTESDDDAVTRSSTGSDAIAHTTARPCYDAFTCDTIGLEGDAVTHNTTGSEDDAVTRSTTGSEDDAVTHSTTGSEVVAHTTARPLLFQDEITCNTTGLDTVARYNKPVACEKINYKLHYHFIAQSQCGEPKYVLVRLMPPLTQIHISPSVAWVKRCVGHCDYHTLDSRCTPRETRIRHIPTRLINVETDREWCSSYKVEEHVSCNCCQKTEGCLAAEIQLSRCNCRCPKPQISIIQLQAEKEQT